MIYKGLGFVLSTQSRGRTGTGRPTGVWDQRVYRFRHLGLKACALVSGLTNDKNFWERKDNTFLLTRKYLCNILLKNLYFFWRKVGFTFHF